MRVLDNRSASITFPIAIVASRFNSEITEALVKGALDELERRKFSPGNIQLVWVPGAVEIPIAAQRLAQLGKFDAIVAIGAVIQGDTDHYDYVCRQVSEGCQTVALQNDIPVLFGVLTTQNEEQALARCGGSEGNKGAEAVSAAVETVATLREIP